MTTITADYFRRSALSSHSSPASSSENALIRNMLADTKRAASEAATSLPSRAFADLARVLRECSVPGWDGYNAVAISRATCLRAHAFLDELPVWMSAPDIVPEADGEIAIEWYIAEDQTFSISIGEQGPLHYAGRFGHEDEVYGVKAFNGTCVPDEILQLIGRLLRDPGARRAA